MDPALPFQTPSQQLCGCNTGTGKTPLVQYCTFLFGFLKLLGFSPAVLGEITWPLCPEYLFQTCGSQGDYSFYDLKSS